MSNLHRRLVLIWMMSVALTACKADLPQGCFQCPDGQCPQGQFCREGFCHSSDASDICTSTETSTAREAIEPDASRSSQDASVTRDAAVHHALDAGGDGDGSTGPATGGVGGDSMTAAPNITQMDGSGGVGGTDAQAAGTHASGGKGGEAASTCDAPDAECAAGAKKRDTRACGPCDSGTQTRAFTCTEQCRWKADADWLPCAEISAQCMPMATRSATRACGLCDTGKQTTAQTCTEACAWGEPQLGECKDETAACKPGDTDMQRQACGACNTGNQTRSRTCTDACSWGAWSAWSACGGVSVECTPGTPAQTRTVDCTTCGTRNQQRTCNPNSCSWDGWTDTSACTWCEQCSIIMYCDTPDNVAANRGTWCRQQACSREQALGDCREDVARVCGTLIEPFFMD